MKWLHVIFETTCWYAYIFLISLNNVASSKRSTIKQPLSEKKNDIQRKKCIWIFCSTIGEFNACKMFIAKFIGNRDVLFITDRDCYNDAFKSEFPKAKVVNISGSHEEIDDLIMKYNPISFVACEIPCSPSDAPCRLSYALVRKLKKTGIKLYLVNGWLYEYPASCREDMIERFLFQKYFINSFEIITVQTQRVKELLIDRGGDGNKIHVTGNMKFDAVVDIDFSVDGYILDYFEINKEQIITAGCVTEAWEYEVVLDTYIKVLVRNPKAKLIIAPRHPEKDDQLELLASKISNLHLTYMFRSMWSDVCDFESQILIVDTFGELKSFYAYADVCYVGVDHNILEPLAFSKPVVVLSNWNKQYPSFPVFEVLSTKCIISVCKTSEELSNCIIKAFNNELVVNQLDVRFLSGALDKNMALIK